MKVIIIKVTDGNKVIKLISFGKDVEECKSLLHARLLRNSDYQGMLIDTEVYSEVSISIFKNKHKRVEDFGDNGYIKYMFHYMESGECIPL